MKNKFTRRDETTAWPFIRWIESRNRWMVDARTKDGGRRRFFEKKAEAEGWRQTQLVKRDNQGSSAFDDRELRARGKSVQDAIRFYVAHLRLQEESETVKDAVAALVEFKRGRVGEIRIADIQNRLARFTEACGEKTMAQVTPDDINAFLS